MFDDISRPRNMRQTTTADSATRLSSSHLNKTASAKLGAIHDLGREVEMQTIKDTNQLLVGFIDSDGSVVDSRYVPVGWIQSGGRVLDSRYVCVGWVSVDGSILDSNLVQAGWCRGGRVLDANLLTIGWAESVAGAAALLLLL